MTFVKKVDVIVVGVGIMGAATTRALARRGLKVVALERFALGHGRGSSHGRSRIFRYSYREQQYAEMAVEALPMWRELESEQGAELLTVTGGVDAGDGIDQNAQALEHVGAAYEWIQGRNLHKRFSTLQASDAEEVLYQPDAGYISADRALQSFVVSARQHGAEVQEGAHVAKLEVGDGVGLALGRVQIEAPVAVVTAGGWARGLLEPVGIDLPVQVRRETLGFFHVVGDMPPAFVEWGHPTNYGLPSPGEGFKAGLHIAGPVVDPDDEGQIDLASLQRAASWIQKRFPTVEPSAYQGDVCLYTMTEDESFILERHGPVVVGSPCSGHGFKFAPLIGERLADLATS